MTAAVKKVFPLGLASVRMYAYSSATGKIAATGATAYDGVLLGGPNVLTEEAVGREYFVHPGNNGPLQYDSLPGLDPLKGSIEGSRKDLDTLALITGVKVHTEGETQWVSRNTDTENKNLPSFALVAYRQGKGQSGTTTIWNTFVYLSATIAPQNDGMQRAQKDNVYGLTFSKVANDITNRPFTAAADGCLSASKRDGVSNHRLHWAFFLGDNTEDEFPFTASLLAANTTDMNVYIDGVERTLNVTKAVDKITFAVTMPGAGALIAVKYALADDAVDVD